MVEHLMVISFKIHQSSIVMIVIHVGVSIMQVTILSASSLKAVLHFSSMRVVLIFMCTTTVRFSLFNFHKRSNTHTFATHKASFMVVFSTQQFLTPRDCQPRSKKEMSSNLFKADVACRNSAHVTHQTHVS